MPETHRTQTSPNLRYGSNAGQPLTRRDGFLKVTGRATYAADNHPEGMLYAVCAVSTIARGRVAHLDVEAAMAHPHVVEVITPANRPPLAGDPEAKEGLFSFRLEALQDDRVRYANQPIALVVAKTLEAATEGVALLKPRYEVESARLDSISSVSSRRPWGSVRHRAPRMATSRRDCRGRRSASMRPTKRRLNTTTRWSRTPSSPRGMATA